MKQLLEKLSNASGVSGFEDNVRNLMMEELKGFVDELDVDNMGNLIAIKKGKPDGKKVMLAAHMDEIGLIVRYIDKNGFIKFSKLGGINDQMLLNQEVYIHSNGEKILGVIGSKPPHRMKAAEKKKPVEYENMFIDIGASSKEDAEEMINVGDPITIKQKFAELKNDLVMGNAMDNRVGCAILLEVMKRARSDATICGVGTVQEEVGLKGARTAAFRINPDMALALDVTISGDHPGMKEEEAPAKAGKGPCIILTDASGRGIITHPQVKELLIQVAEEEEIPYQIEVSEGGTTDATAIHLTREGIPTGVISPPSRYIHTPVSVVNIKDVENAVKLILAVLNRL
ncbi:MAG: M42 family metallopeptidase [Methanobacterium formicicum]|jgi:endoglucanase|uniref:Putative aminopeptidase MJ0555 n=2 Tax=Methanobacterium formicicum TaxID=2162 RepID=A0A090IAE6_METFO|nr:MULTISPECIES: M42 family metallopeptidase [Methanobacterium]AXV39323.1 MAG: peptidase M42 [Methanobacterium sp. BAmetb5]MDD4810238.1 M42 family metallopeptidase [Methanobacterium formicicum]MDG3547490.1 M42 family metallopeptidase [Methanobacterium formicicum]MDH2659287.1 M42 family metallopeptidase [Methanobacterium formicicum]CEA14417.1 putative aminopeptidase MJ0555 [Methanobacterium formicicum]